LAEVVRLYGLRNWIEQSYKQMKDELGWADFMVRSDRAIRRHWTLVCCAFAFCWWNEAREVLIHETVTPPSRKKTRPDYGCDVAGRACCAQFGHGLPRWTGSCDAGKPAANKPPPPELAALFEILIAGCGINLYLRI
jgi:hypothetical protein